VHKQTRTKKLIPRNLVYYYYLLIELASTRYQSEDSIRIADYNIHWTNSSKLIENADSDGGLF